MTIQEAKQTLQGLPPSSDGETTARNIATINEVLQMVVDWLSGGDASNPKPEQEAKLPPPKALEAKLPPVPPRAPLHKTKPAPVHHAKKHMGRR